MYFIYLRYASELIRIFGVAAILAVALIANTAATAAMSVAIHAPYWQIGAGLDTTLIVNNTRPRNITVTPRVYNGAGEELPSNPFTVDAMGAKTVPLREILADGVNNAAGYVELQYTGTPVDLAAQVLIEDRTQNRLWNHVFESRRRLKSSRYEGVFTGAGAFEGATLIVTNVSNSTTAITFQISANGNPSGDAFQLPAGNQRVIALTKYLAQAQTPGRRAAGITVSHSGAPGDVLVQGLARIGGGGSYNIRLVDSARLKSDRLIGPALALPWAHTPFLALHNTGEAPSSVSLVAHFRTPAANEPQQAVLQQLSLNGHGATVTDLRDALNTLPDDAEDIGLEAAVYDSQGRPLAGRTVADLLLLADAGRQVIQVSPKDPEGEGFEGFSQPWDISGSNRTVIAMTNPSKTDRLGIMVSFHYAGGHYSYDARTGLAPGETKHISVNDLRDLQVPGILDQKFPPDATQGQAIVSVQGEQEVRWVLLAQSIISDPSRQVSLSSSCSTCPPNATSYGVSPLIVDGRPGDQVSLTPVCFLDNGSQTVISNPFAIDWAPVNSSIAWVTATWGSFKMNFGSAGGTTVNTTSHDCTYEFDFDSQSCVCTELPFAAAAAPQARTRVPKWVALTFDDATVDPLCSPRALQKRTYTGLDDFGYITFNLNWRLNEALTFKHSSCGTVGTGSTLNDSVTFSDRITIGCSTPATCVFETNQTFSVAVTAPPGKPQAPLVQVKGKNCVNAQGTKLPDTQCLAKPEHTGWHVRATSSAITVTDNP
ncbi:MAG: hypothetical protein L0Z50_02725 [Verrucomicrobiales bacterium]|nr:hypothetical protein [Verrucomicrobiales bacterium]